MYNRPPNFLSVSITTDPVANTQANTVAIAAVPTLRIRVVAWTMQMLQNAPVGTVTRAFMQPVGTGLGTMAHAICADGESYTFHFPPPGIVTGIGDSLELHHLSTGVSIPVRITLYYYIDPST